MNNIEIIQQLKLAADNFSKEEISEIIELASKAYLKNQPFISEEEVAEQTLAGFIAQLSKTDKETISKAKAKIASLIP